MSRLNILTKDEINLFDKPPRFSPEQRQKYFHLNEKLISLLKSLRSATNKVCLVLQWGVRLDCLLLLVNWYELF